jgi:hypothetical protein
MRPNGLVMLAVLIMTQVPGLQPLAQEAPTAKPKSHGIA